MEYKQVTKKASDLFQSEKIKNSLYEISNTTHIAKDLNDLYKSIHKIIGNLMPARNFYLALYDSDTNSLSFPYFKDRYDTIPLRKKLGKGCTEYVLKTGKPQLITPKNFKELVKHGEVELIGSPSLDWIGVPLKTDNKTIGVLVVQTYYEGIRYCEEDKNILSFVADQVAIAIERKQVEEALKESEVMYRTLVETSPEAVTVTDLEGVITYVSQRTLEQQGFKRDEELLGRNVFDLIAPEDRERAMANLQKTQKEGFIRDLKYTLLKQDGTRFVGEISASLIKDSSGKPKAFITTTRDISERKRAEEALTVKSMYLDNILRSATEYAIATTDLNFRITYYNPMAEKLHGYKAEEVIGKTVQEIHIKEKVPAERLEEAIENIHRTGEQCYTVVKETEEGTRYIKVRVSGIYDSNGKLTGYANFARDITDLKKVEEELKAAQEYSRNLIDSSLDMIISVDKMRRIAEFNPAAQKTFGYSKDDVLGKHINILYADPTEGLKSYKTTRKTGQFSGEILNKRKNGETFPSFLSASVLCDEDGEFMGVMGVSRDISDHVKIRNELENALEQAEEGNRVKTLFLANMSHEIRTPLASILGFTELIEKSVSHLIDKEKQTFFEIIRHSSNRLLGTMHKILDISQIQAGTLDLSPKLLNLMELTEKTVKEFKPMAKNKGLELSYLSKTENAVVRADEYCITSALSNLIDNALKYTEKGKVDVTLKGMGKNLSLTIKDTGIGISEEYMEQLFEIFSQESMGSTKKFQGVGLGMALTKQYLDMNNVSLDVQSTKDQGTTFILTFKLFKGRRPKVGAKLKEALPVELVKEPSKKPIVLLVEDDIASQKLTSFFIKRKYDTCFAVSVAKAKERLRKHKVDLILLDLSLYGDEDGLDLARYVRKTKKWREIPIVAVTAHAFTTDQTNCLAAGCNDYMAKPIKQDDLLAKLKQYISTSI